ncbi:hypothetical protein H4K36_14935 [Streptomyces sp. DHE7-1]|nr:hypothetical protein [Streptomyces sp. DHE7-1]
MPVPSAAAQADATCAASGDRAFPLATRIHGGPGAYEAGGGFGTWYLDLTNSTGRTCTDLHPVVVLVDDKRALKPSQPKLEFYDGTRALPVAFESTDAQELVGVLDAEGFDGFTVPPGRTVTVKLRLFLTSDAVSDQVTANAAVVQRRGDDGDWVGESNAYRFSVAGGPDGRQQDEEQQEGNGTPTPGDGDASAGPDSSASPGVRRARTAAPAPRRRRPRSAPRTPGPSPGRRSAAPIRVPARCPSPRPRSRPESGPGSSRGPGSGSPTGCSRPSPRSSWWAARPSCWPAGAAEGGLRPPAPLTCDLPGSRSRPPD